MLILKVSLANMPTGIALHSVFQQIFMEPLRRGQLLQVWGYSRQKQMVPGRSIPGVSIRGETNNKPTRMPSAAAGHRCSEARASRERGV